MLALRYQAKHVLSRLHRTHEQQQAQGAGEEAGPVNSFAKGNLLDSIKAKSTMKETVDSNTDEISKVTADVQSAKLKQLLGQIKSN